MSELNSSARFSADELANRLTFKIAHCLAPGAADVPAET